MLPVFLHPTLLWAVSYTHLFIAANPTVEKMVASAEEAGYRLLDRADLNSSEHGIGGVRLSLIHIFIAVL